MSGIIGITCDDCGASRTTDIWRTWDTVGEVRAEARPLGWRTRKALFTSPTGQTVGYTRDICPECWAKGVR